MRSATAPAKTVTERVAALRQRRLGLGLTRLEVFAHPDDHLEIKKLAKKLTQQRKAEQSIKNR
jgi:hypothetical protein